MFVTPKTKSPMNRFAKTRDKSQLKNMVNETKSKSRTPSKTLVLRTHLRALERGSVDKNCAGCTQKENN